MQRLVILRSGRASGKRRLMQQFKSVLLDGSAASQGECIYTSVRLQGILDVIGRLADEDLQLH